MPEIFNKDNIDPETLSDGALRRVLLDDTITSNDNIRLDHWDLGSGCTMPLSVARGDITWLQVLDGAGARQFLFASKMDSDYWKRIYRTRIC